MSQVPAPTGKSLRNRIATKLGVAVATLLVPAFVLAYLLFANINNQIDFAQGELTGTKYLNVCRQGIAESIEHRRLVSDYLTGVPTTKAQLSQQQAKVEELFVKIDEIDRALTAQTKQTNTKKALEATQDAWKALTALLATAQPGQVEKSYETLLAYDAFISSYRDLVTEACNGSKLTLDPESASYALMFGAQKLLEDADLLGRVQWRAAVAAAAGDKILPTDRKLELARFQGMLERVKADIDSGFAEVLNERKNDLAPALQKPTKNWIDRRDGFLANVDTQVVRSAKVELTSQKITLEAGETLEAVHGYFDSVLPLLETELKTRISQFRRTLVFGVAALSVGLFLAIGVVFVITRGFTRQIRAYLDVFAQVDTGDYSVQVQKLTKDELGEMTGSLNKVFATTDALIRKQKEDYEGLQQSIMKLLEDVSGTADGDLTREAEVTADATGAIADSFNHMLEQMRKIIGDVQDATLNVSTSATQIQVGTEQLASGSESQAEQIVNTTIAIDEMAASVRQVSENAQLAAGIAKEALATAVKGNDSVSNTIDGMGRIRDQAQETAKRIKRLGESSQEIGQIVQLIEDIADRTSILALNASIQAAAAGEAGRGFAVVAAEVERLAERSSEATKKIGTLIRTIQSETNEAVGSMEKGINEVVEGSKLANQAGKSLEDIQTVSKRLAELIQSISQAANQQSRGSDELAKSMNDISTVTRETAHGTKQAADSVSQLALLADNLRGSVSQFKLPQSASAAPVAPSNRLGANRGERQPALAGR